MRLRLRLVLALLLCAGVSWLAQVASANTPTAGGSGGARFDLACREGEVLVGVRGIAGSWMNRIGLICHRVGPQGQWIGMPSNRGRAGGDGDMLTRSFAKTCPRDHAVTGFRGRAGQYVHSLDLECRDLTGASTTGGSVVFAGAVGGDGGNAFSTRSCAGNLPATGALGSAGIYVDSFGLKCGDESIYRPAFHFSPKRGWMNDPAGLVFLDGRYHLYFQSVPGQTTFDAEQMTWGHASSTDLIRWTQTDDPPVFTRTEEQIAPLIRAAWVPFTGSAITLPKEHPHCRCTSGGGSACILAIFTQHMPGLPTPAKQRQSIAPSCDGGRTFEHQGRAVLENGAYPLQPHARDPKLFRHGQQWVMALAAGAHVDLFSSRDLTSWQPLSRIRVYADDHVAGPFVETADLFELPVAGSSETRWVLTFAEGYLPPVICQGLAGILQIVGNECERALSNDSLSFYAVGHFDGRRFVPEREPGRPLRETSPRMDSGPDFYASQSWFGVPARARTTSSDRERAKAQAQAKARLQAEAKSEALAKARAKAKAEAKARAQQQAGQKAQPGKPLLQTVKPSVMRRDAEEEEEEAQAQGAEAEIEEATAAEGAEAEIDEEAVLEAFEEEYDLAEDLDDAEDALGLFAWAEPDEEADGEASDEVQERAVSLRAPIVVAGWQSNWRYAHRLPTQAWRGHLSIARELGLVREGSRHVLVQRPVSTAPARRGPARREELRSFTGRAVIPNFSARAFQADVAFQLGSASEVGLEVRAGSQRRTRVGWRSAGGGRLFVDRRASWGAGGEPPNGFAREFVAPLPRPANGTLRLRVLVDHSSLEVFAEDGRAVISTLIFPAPDDEALALFARGQAGGARVHLQELGPGS